MRRRWSGIVAELVPLVLILACLAGSLALVVTIHRRFVLRSTSKSVVAVVSPPIPAPPIPAPAPPPMVVEAEEPEPPTPPAPEDPTPKAIEKFTAAEAEQLLEASRADRKAAALEVARKSALAESEKWRRRESLAKLQLDTIDTKVRKLETEIDALALERDALERERDIRKALASQDRSRPSQAILPHRGQNGTWRRPIVIECVNGSAILRPQGIGFGLLEIASGFGPASNPFVATIAREAIRIQGNTSPDGQPVVPYIFFLVRPDGIRSYYEARGRLEPLGITFGYELADQDWEIDFPDLDDIKSWDGSSPSRPEGFDPLGPITKRSDGATNAEDEEFPSWGNPRRSAPPTRENTPDNDFTWPSTRRPSGDSGGRVNLGNLGGSGVVPSTPTNRSAGPRPVGLPAVPAWIDSLGGPSNGSEGHPGDSELAVRPPGGPSGIPKPGASRGTGAGTRPGAGQLETPSDAPRELALGGGRITTLGPASPARPPRPVISDGPSPAATRLGSQTSGDLPPVGPPPDLDQGRGSGAIQDRPKVNPPDDPANSFVWPKKPNGGARGDLTGGLPTQIQGLPDQTPPVRHIGPFSRPLAMGIDSAASANATGSPNLTVEADPTQPDGLPSGGTKAALASRSQNSPSAVTTGSQGSSGITSADRAIGQPASATGTPPSGSSPPLAVGMGASGTPSNGRPSSSAPPSGSTNHSSQGPSMPDVPSSKIVDRRFEIVLVCGPRGVIVQPGTNRVTNDALKDRDGLLKKQMVALVKAKRTADPKVTVEPKVRFLIQPGGEKNYWTARSQFLISGLDWPMSTQVADPDHLTIIPAETW